jgi:hypothetical protein
MNLGSLVTGIAGIVAIIFILGLVLSFPIWILWNNCLVGAVDGVNEITWLQAWGINVLFAGLFKANIQQSK